jgi:hypothetical protein
MNAKRYAMATYAAAVASWVTVGVFVSWFVWAGPTLVYLGLFFGCCAWLLAFVLAWPVRCPACGRRPFPFCSRVGEGKCCGGTAAVLALTYHFGERCHVPFLSGHYPQAMKANVGVQRRDSLAGARTVRWNTGVGFSRMRVVS